MKDHMINNFLYMKYAGLVKLESESRLVVFRAIGGMRGRE